jgi:regulation of enolase protein 1 (concanavalin A-like superfamily)
MKHKIRTIVGTKAIVHCFAFALATTMPSGSVIAAGATTPFTSLEAESGTLGGGASISSLTSPPSTQYSSPELEASGRSFVLLDGTGESVTWTNSTGQNITAINVRYSIPDAAGGGGINATLNLYVNGVFRQSLSLSSAQTWVYESSSNYNGMSQSPSAGTPHVFYEEVSAFVQGAAIAPGSTIKLQKDSANTASYYRIDVIDLESPPAALSQPANSLSVVTYGAVANNPSVNNLTAIQNCINAAQSMGKQVWIPQGVFYVNTSGGVGGLTASGITISGAGMWYSTIYNTMSLPASSVSAIISPTSCTLRDFAIDSIARSRTEADGDSGAIDIKGSGWLVERMWIRHTSSGVWASGSNGTVRDCRVNNTWGDGVNLNNGGGSASSLTADNNFVRGVGDDGVTIDSAAAPKTQTSDLTLSNNTSIAVWWAHGVAVYGGINSKALNNLSKDTTKFEGLYIGTFPNDASLISATADDNTVVRGGGMAYNRVHGAMMVGTEVDKTNVANNIIARGNTIEDAIFAGLDIQKSTNVVIEDSNISNPGTEGVRIVAGATGSAAFNNNVVSGASSGSDFVNYASNNDYITGGIGGNFNIGPWDYFLPSAWQAASVGSLGVTSGASYNSSVFTLVASGADIGGTADAFEYVYQGVTGNCTIIARAKTIEQINEWSKAGIMIRNALTASAMQASVVLTPEHGVIFQCRASTGGSTSTIGSAAASGEVWIKLTRSGSTFAGYYSTNGLSWTSLGSTTISMSTSVTFGLAATSHDNAALCSAMLDHVMVRTIPIGQTISLQAVINNKWVCADNAGASPLIANKTSASTWEKFTVVDMSSTAGPGYVALIAQANGKYVCAEDGGASSLIANRTSAGPWETFYWNDNGDGTVNLQAWSNARWVTAENAGTSPLLARMLTPLEWETYNLLVW